jgi:hypothetical protein
MRSPSLLADPCIRRSTVFPTALQKNPLKGPMIRTQSIGHTQVLRRAEEENGWKTEA